MFLTVMNQQGLIGRFVCENKFQIRTFISENCGTEDEANIYKREANDPIMCRYFCIGSIGFMLTGKSFLGYANLFTPNEYEKEKKNNKNTKIVFNF